MENQAIESFINFCDNMQIADEGFGSIGQSIRKAIEWIITKIKALGRRIRDAIRVLFGKETLREKELAAEILRTKQEQAEVNAKLIIVNKAVSDYETKITNLESAADTLQNCIDAAEDTHKLDQNTINSLRQKLNEKRR